MSTLVAEEELESTRGERLLALLFAIFIAIGLIWGYAKLDEPFRPVDPAQTVVVTDPAIQAHDAALETYGRAGASLSAANLALEQSREAYRTSLDAGKPSALLEQAYQRAQATQRAAADAEATAKQRVDATEGPAEAARKRLDADNQRKYDRARLLTFLVRLPYVLGTLALSFWLLSRYRHRSRRRLPLFYAGVGATTLLALVLATDYLTDYINLEDLGPLLISIIGVTLSLAAFIALQRALLRRVPGRRVRRGECPFCGYPVRQAAAGTDSTFCEGCGRDVVGECSSCHQPRRVGTPHCSACGAA